MAGTLTTSVNGSPDLAGRVPAVSMGAKGLTMTSSRWCPPGTWWERRLNKAPAVPERARR